MRPDRLASLLVAAGLLALAARAAEFPQPSEADYVIKDFRFASGESLPALRIHYRVLGRPERGADGTVRNVYRKVDVTVHAQEILADLGGG